MDWFQPFKQALVQYILTSLEICNYKPENVIFCQGERNLLLWEGIVFDISPYAYDPIQIRAALFCITSDSPATRKVCGFASPSTGLTVQNVFYGRQAELFRV